MNEQSFEKEIVKSLQGKALYRIFRTSKPHWGWMVGFIFFIALTAILDSTGTYLSKFLIDEGIMPRDIEMVKHYAFRYGMVYLGNSISIFFFIFCAGRLGEWIQYDLRGKLFDHLQKLSFSFFDKTSSGWLLSRITSDTRRIAELASWNLLDTIWGVFNIITALIFMSFINVKLSLVILGIMPLLLITAFKFKGHLIKEYRKVRSINSEITSSYSESISGVRVVKALNKEKANLHRFGKLTGRMYQASYRAAWLSALFLPTVQLVTSLAIAAILWYGGWQIGEKTMTIGGLRAFIGYVSFMLWPIQELSRVFSEMQQSIASAERVYSLVDQKPAIKDQQGASTTASFRGRIELKNVDFHYKEDQPIFKDFNLRVEEGEKIAIVGPTGGGKTTLVNLISRYYEPVSGEVHIDGTDYRNYTQQALQGRLGVVLQTPHLFSGTIRENILYGRLNATEEEMLEASKLACAHQMIVDLPKGYDEPIGEEGTLLSLGQKQLISLARTILADPDIIIMDEATSSIDTLTERDIQKGMDSLLQDRTGFIIAHRLSTIRNADRILVIEGGKICEEGSHQSLLREKGHYYQLYTSQFRQDRSKEAHLLD